MTPELYARLVPVERQIARALIELTSIFVGDLAVEPDSEAQVQLALTAVRGLALTEQFEPRGPSRRDLWPEVRRVLLRALGQG